MNADCSGYLWISHQSIWCNAFFTALHQRATHPPVDRMRSDVCFPGFHEPLWSEACVCLGRHADRRNPRSSPGPESRFGPRGRH